MKGFLSLALFVGALTVTPGAFANISDNLLTVEANVGGTWYGYSLFTADDPRGELVYEPSTQTWTWTLLVDVPIISFDGQLLLGTLQAQETQVRFAQDPVVNLNFAVQAGPAAGGTAFTCKSALLSFPTINNASARTSAAFTLTDGVDDDGATLTPAAGELGAYKAQYNGFVPGGTTFAQLIPQMVAAPMDQATLAEDFPGGGMYQALGVPVYDMSSQVSFTLSPNDLASGTSVFEIIPEPSALALLAVALGLVGRRR